MMYLPPGQALEVLHIGEQPGLALLGGFALDAAVFGFASRRARRLLTLEQIASLAFSRPEVLYPQFLLEGSHIAG